MNIDILLLTNFKLLGFSGDLIAKVQDSLLSAYIIVLLSLLEVDFNVKLGTANSFAAKIKHRISK